MGVDELPVPDSDELKKLIGSTTLQEIYRVMYENRDNGVTMLEIRDAVEPITGPQAQLGRRRRDLNPYFVVTRERNGNEALYRLKSLKARSADAAGISEKTRAEVLQYGRCAMCGKTALEDHVRLQVDHRMPQSLGGSNEIENLQPLCEECNRGKKNHFSSFGPFADQITAAMSYQEPQRRIAEMLLAFDGEWVRSDLIELVVHANQYQEDWQKRMRELREIGWDYEYKKVKEEGRVRTYYRLTHSEPWPQVSFRDEVRRRKKLRKG